jgi:hypothetical protein
VDGEFKIEEITHPSKPEVKVPLIYVRVNANIRCATLEESRMSRKLNHISSFRSHNRDTKADLQRLCLDRSGELSQRIHFPFKDVSQEQLSLFMNRLKIQHGQASVDTVDSVMNDFREKIFQQCEAELSRHEKISYESFSDKFEHACLLAEMLSVKKWAIAKLLWFIEDSAQELETLLEYPLQKSYREYVSFCRNRIQMEGNPDMKRNQARALCQLLGFIGSSRHDMARDDTPIVQAVENGASAHDVDLLLVAGFDVDSVCPSGNSLLCIAVRFGYLHVAEALIGKRANVNFVNIYDGTRTPVMFAASHGHLSCLQILLQNGARASKEGFEVAMQNGHNSCATLLQKADASCATLVAKVDASCETRDVPSVVQKQITPMLTDNTLQWAYSHDFPAEDLSQCGAENGWPPGFFGPKKSSALIAAGVTTFTQLMEVVGSRSMEQFCAEYGSCLAGAHGRDARAMWLLVSAWEREKKSRV